MVRSFFAKSKRDPIPSKTTVPKEIISIILSFFDSDDISSHFKIAQLNKQYYEMVDQLWKPKFQAQYTTDLIKKNFISAAIQVQHHWKKKRNILETKK